MDLLNTYLREDINKSMLITKNELENKNSIKFYDVYVLSDYFDY